MGSAIFSGHSLRLRPHGLVPWAMLLFVCLSACGLRVDPTQPQYRGFFTGVVSAAGAAAGDGGFPHGAIIPAPTHARVAHPLRNGEVYMGTVPLRVHLPDLNSAVDSVTYPQWAALFLGQIRAPVCGNNLVAVVAWQAQEGTRAAWNPLATTEDAPGATQFNSVGVRNYPSLEEGLAATVFTLTQGQSSFGYGPIVQALRACAPPMITAQAIQYSQWCRYCAGGRYLTALIPAVVADFNRAFVPRSTRR